MVLKLGNKSTIVEEIIKLFLSRDDLLERGTVMRKFELYGSTFVTRMKSNVAHGSTVHSACILEKDFHLNGKPVVVLHHLATLQKYEDKGYASKLLRWIGINFID